eukprot:1327495-Amorphochlora_amoeboformis.AAC.1
MTKSGIDEMTAGFIVGLMAMGCLVSAYRFPTPINPFDRHIPCSEPALPIIPTICVGHPGATIEEIPCSQGLLGGQQEGQHCNRCRAHNTLLNLPRVGSMQFGSTT